MYMYCRKTYIVATSASVYLLRGLAVCFITDYLYDVCEIWYTGLAVPKVYCSSDYNTETYVHIIHVHVIL